MELNISQKDSGLVLFSKIKSYLVYPAIDEKLDFDREKAWMSFYLSLLDHNSKDLELYDYFTPQKLLLLNDSLPITTLKKKFSTNKKEIFTTGILMRLLTSGERYHAKKMSLNKAATIYANRYQQLLDKGELKKDRAKTLSGAKNHWNKMNGVQHLCAAWQCYNPGKKHEEGLSMKKRVLKFLAIADRFYKENLKQKNSWRKKSLLTPDNAWVVPSSLKLPEFDESLLKIIPQERFGEYYQDFVLDKKKK